MAYVLSFGGVQYAVDHAVKGPDFVHGYDVNGKCIVALDGIKDHNLVTYNGTYLSPDICLDEPCNAVKYVNGSFVRADGTPILSEVESDEYPGCFYRQIVGGGMAVTVEEEWINPPMIPGEEYRTTERFNGKPVYTMLVDCGSIFNGSDKSQTFTVDVPLLMDPNEWALRLVDVSGTVWGYLDSTKYSFYPIDSCPLLSKYEVAYNYDYLRLYITTTGDDPHTNTTAYVTLKYIKEYF